MLDRIVEDLKSNGRSPFLDVASQSIYRTPPVDMHTFLTDNYFLGKFGRSLFEPLKEDLFELFNNKYSEAFIGGSIGAGKTTFGVIAMARMIYEVSCLRNPHEAYGIQPNDKIAFLGISVTKDLARDIVGDKLLSIIKDTPYFQKEFKPLKSLEYEILLPNGIWIAPGVSTERSTLGANCFGAIIDESNFFKKKKGQDDTAKDYAEAIYTSIKRRMESRFMVSGKLPGLLLCISSKKTVNSFTEKRIKQSIDDPNVFVRERAVYEVQPQGRYSGHTFKVAIGNDSKLSRVLADGESDPEEMRVIDVPVEFKKAFEDDLDGCLTGDTEIPLLNGQCVPIKDLVGKKEFWVYSCGLDGTLKPGLGYDARLTKKNALIYEIVLDNDAVVKCTDNHEFLLRSGEYKRADELTVGDSLMPLYRTENKGGYETYKCNKYGMKLWTHRAVAVETKLSKGCIDNGYVVHHINEDKKDNSPDNLEIMSNKDHVIIHRSRSIKFLHSDESRKKSAKKRSDLIKRGEEKWVKKFKKRSSDQMIKYNKSDHHKKIASKIGKKYGWGSDNPTEKQKIARKKNIDNFIEFSKKNNIENNPAKKQDAKNKIGKAKKKWCSDNPGFMNNIASWGGHLRWHNKRSIKKDGCYWCDNDSNDPNNHKVKEIKISGREDVYDISVEKYNNFLVGPGVFVHNSIRDISGYATAAISPFFARRDKIYESFDNRTHPFKDLIWVQDAPIVIHWNKLIKTNVYGENAPLLNPQAPRHIHMDLSKNNDLTGICMAHVGGYKRVSRLGQADELLPIYIVDFHLKIEAPTNGEIVQSEIRQLIYRIHANGFFIKKVTCDQYQSVGMLQTLKQRGYQVELVSMDRVTQGKNIPLNAPYVTLKNAFYENRIRQYRYEPLLTELKGLEKDAKTGKIDHPEGNSKDSSDALCGAIYTLSRDTRTYMTEDTQQNAQQYLAFDDDDQSWVCEHNMVAVRTGHENRDIAGWEEKAERKRLEKEMQNQSSIEGGPYVNWKKNFSMPFVTG